MIGIRPCSPRSARRQGYLMLEAVAALGMLTLLLGGLLLHGSHTRGMARIQASRQLCLSAARGQLDLLAAGGKPLGQAESADLWPDVRLAVRRSPGQGDWQGLTLVEVTASASPGQGAAEVQVVLRQYIDEEVQP